MKWVVDVGVSCLLLNRVDTIDSRHLDVLEMADPNRRV